MILESKLMCPNDLKYIMRCNPETCYNANNSDIHKMILKQCKQHKKALDDVLPFFRNGNLKEIELKITEEYKRAIEYIDYMELKGVIA